MARQQRDLARLHAERGPPARTRCGGFGQVEIDLPPGIVVEGEQIAAAGERTEIARKIPQGLGEIPRLSARDHVVLVEYGDGHGHFLSDSAATLTRMKLSIYPD
ncbi:hypothetical protein NRB_44270 [Novosphingobium sp. 11B]